MFSLRYFCKLGFMCPSDAAFIFSFFVYAARAKTVQPRHRLRFHGLMRLRHRNSGLCPSDSLAATAPFVSWNGAIASDGLPMPSPCRIRKCMINSNITPGTLPCTNPYFRSSAAYASATFSTRFLMMGSISPSVRVRSSAWNIRLKATDLQPSATCLPV